jgi:hypothetical protein
VDALQLLRARNRHDVILGTGLEVTLRLPNLKQCVFAGGIPMPVVAEWASQATTNGKRKEPKPDPERELETARHMMRYQQEVVRASLLSIGQFLGEGEIPLDVTTEIVEALQEEEFDEVFAYGSRAKPLPTKAGATT